MPFKKSILVCLLVGAALFGMAKPSYAENSSPLINWSATKPTYSSSVSNFYVGEINEYVAAFTVPKNIAFGEVDLYIKKDAQDFSNSALSVEGLPPGNIEFDKNQTTNTFTEIHYILPTSTSFTADSIIKFTLSGIVNAPRSPSEGNSANPPAPYCTIYGFSNIRLLATPHNDTDMASLQNDNTHSYECIHHRQLTSVFNTDVNFESTSHYFSEPTTYTFSFNLTKGMYVGRAGISYDAGENGSIDLSSATLEVTGLPPGITKITPNADKVASQNFSYTLSQKTLLTEDTRVTFTIRNIRNPVPGYPQVGISSQVYISQDTNGQGGNTTFSGYNEDYFTGIYLVDHYPVHLYGNWSVPLSKNPSSNQTVDTPQPVTTYTLTVPTSSTNVTQNTAPAVVTPPALTTPTIVAPAVVPNTATNLLPAITTTGTSITTTPNAPTFTRPLIIGSRGKDVTQLQTILINKKLLSTKKTDYFGILTKNALLKLQKRYHAKQTGTVNKETLTILNSLATE